MTLGWFRLLVVLSALVGLSGMTEAIRTVTWNDLKPRLAPIAGTLQHIDPSQRYEISVISEIRQRGEGSDQGSLLRAEELADRLAAQGLDVDLLVHEFRLAKMEARRRKELLVEDLDGQSVRIKGYLLPLEYSELGASEFLLVPYVGACIHVPPPPKNQIVYVRLEQSFKTASLFTPVEVAGRLHTESTQQELRLVDGSGQVSVGYTLDGANVTVIEQ